MENRRAFDKESFIVSKETCQQRQCFKRQVVVKSNVCFNAVFNVKKVEQ